MFKFEKYSKVKNVQKKKMFKHKNVQKEKNVQT
jgi:hypothetical protein